jgi:uncharacterized protein YraI
VTGFWGSIYHLLPRALIKREAAAFNAARRAVPAVDFAIGAAVVAAVAALVFGVSGHARAALIIFAGMLLAIVCVTMFARLLSGQNAPIKIAGVTIVWAVVVFFITFLAFTATAVAFKWPSGWASFLGFEDPTKASVGLPPPNPSAPCLEPGEKIELGSCRQADGNYIVVNIRWDDADRGLVVRESPGIAGVKRGVLPPNATDIIVGPCEAEWCPVQCNRLKGWSRARYLALRSTALYSVTAIKPTDPQGLAVRNGPHHACSPVGSIPHDGRDVALHSCEPSPLGRSTWCRITHKGLTGWVADGFLERQD